MPIIVTWRDRAHAFLIRHFEWYMQIFQTNDPKRAHEAHVAAYAATNFPYATRAEILSFHFICNGWIMCRATAHTGGVNPEEPMHITALFWEVEDMLEGTFTDQNGYRYTNTAIHIYI
jgi:hypothetical protein